MKKMISVLSLVALLVCLMAPCVCATCSEGITPRWTGVIDVNAYLDFYGTEGEATLASSKDSSAPCMPAAPVRVLHGNECFAAR